MRLRDRERVSSYAEKPRPVQTNMVHVEPLIWFGDGGGVEDQSRSSKGVKQPGTCQMMVFLFIP
jgi:hypothetical protein